MRRKPLVTILAAAQLVWLALAPGASALLDIPTSDRLALDVADLASDSGLTRPLDTGDLPLDDTAYLSAYRALHDRGLVDPTGAWYEKIAEARTDGRLHLESLVPRVELRTYYLGHPTERRLLYHTSGDALHQGLNNFLSADGAAVWGERVGGAYEVELRQHSGDFDFRIKRLYLKGVLGKWSLKVGRDAERLGPGYHGSLLLSDNADPMDLWRIRTEEPLFLPGFLKSIGGFRFTLLNAYLSDSRPRPPDSRYGSGVDPVADPRLLAMRLSYTPTSWLDLGVSRAIFYGGKGREAYNSFKDWWELFTARDENVNPGESHRYDNDQYVAFDFTARLPFLNGLGPFRAGKVYWEYGATDIISKWQGENTGSWVPFKLNHVANLGGLYLSTAVTELRLEYARTDPSWYRHGQYPQGYSFRGNPLGHHMGGDARDWFAEVARYFGPAWRAAVSLDVEDRGLSQPTEEQRTEVGASLDALALRAFDQPFEARIETLIGKVNNPFDNPDRSDRNEFYLGLTLRTAL